MLGGGFIFRYEYRSPEAEKENEADNGKQAADMEWQPEQQES